MKEQATEHTNSEKKKHYIHHAQKLQNKVGFSI